jgi:orotidine-5'-phosphate decarboxylase
MNSFASDILIDAINAKKNPCAVGLDPRISMLPTQLKQEALLMHGNTVAGAAWAIEKFCCDVIDAVKDVVAVVKPQVAFFEEYGSLGYAAFEATVRHAKKAELVVITDGKRNDIGSTCEAYARAHFGPVELIEGTAPSPLESDWLTVSPFLGSDGIDPFVEICKESSKGIFVLVKTSNPSSIELQNLQTAHYEPLHHTVAALIKRRSNEFLGKAGYSLIGAVVGATYPDEAKTLRKLLPRSIFLVPGYGAQGGNAKSTMDCFNRDGYGAVINASRSVIFAFRGNESGKGSNGWQSAVRNAAIEMREDIVGELSRSEKMPGGW